MLRIARCYLVDGREPFQRLRENIAKSFPHLLIQVVDPTAVGNERLVEMLGEQTLQAVQNGSPLAQKPEVDLLMRLAGTTQILRAIQAVGVKAGREFVLMVMGEETEVAAFELEQATGWTRLPRNQPSADELHKVEKAALLNAEKT